MPDFEFVKIEKDIFDEDWDGVLAKYELGKQLGSGAFAVVKHVTEKSSGNVFAMKVQIPCLYFLLLLYLSVGHNDNGCPQKHRQCS